MRRANFWDFITLNIGWLGLSVMWNSLHVLLLPTLLLNFVPASQKNGILGIITAIGLLIAMVIQPFAGALSDSWRSRFGRRRPLMAAGTLGDIVFLLVLAYAGGIPLVVIGYIGLQFTSNHAHGAMQGLLPDRLAEDQLGRGSAIKNFFDMLGLIAASFGMGLVLTPGSYNITAGIYVVIAVLVITMTITILTTHEKSTLDSRVTNTQRHTLTSAFKIDWKANRTFAWLIAGRLIFLIGALGIQSFLLYFVRDTLPVANPAAYAGQLTMLVGVGVVAAAFSSGFLTDRFGPRPVHFAAAGSILFGTMLLAFVRSTGIIPVGGMFFGIGLGLFLTTNWALVNRLAPKEEAGKFIGLTNIATAGAGIFGRLLGPAIDGINNLWPGQFLGYPFLFAAAGILAVIGTIVLTTKVFPAFQTKITPEKPVTVSPELLP